MQVVKKYLVWIIIAVLALGFIIFDYVFVGSKVGNVLKENNDIVTKTQSFKHFISSMPKKIPTPKDLEIGSDYLENIMLENKRATAIWLNFTENLENGLKNGEVIYSDPKEKERLGKPVPALVFADFLNNHYLQTMATAENNLAGKLQPVWEKMLTQSFYATNYKATMESAESEVKSSAPAVAAQLAHIYTPAALIPFKLNEDFQKNEKRIRFWRNYLIFKDIVERVIPNTSVDVERDVVAFERPKTDFDETTDVLKTDILRGKGERFIENISALEIKLVKYGNKEIENPFTEAKKSEEDKLLAGGAPKKNAPGAVAQEEDYHDIFEVRIEFTAHPKVLWKFMQTILASKDLYYVPVSHKFERLTDSETMGNYQMPKGGDSVRALADATYAETPANTQSPFLAFEHESPVKASFVYKVYRPRFMGMINISGEDAAAGSNSANKAFIPGL